MIIDNKNELIERYASEKIRGRLLSEIRKELINKGIEENEVRTIIRQIDEKVIDYELNKTKIKINKQILYLGIVLTTLSLIIILLNYFKIFLIQTPAIIAGSTLIAGIFMVTYPFLRFPKRKQ